MSRLKNALFETKYSFVFAVIYSLTVSADSSLSVAEIRCLSDHQDQIRALINVNGQSETRCVCLIFKLQRDCILNPQTV